MSISANAKMNRMLKLLVGLRDQRVMGILKLRGFTRDELDEGWRLMRAAVDVKIEEVPMAAPADQILLDQLDAWENRWYPVVQATLERHFPDLEAKVFANLPRTSGLQLLLTVPVFLRRLGELESGQGEAGKTARALLARRGLTADVVAQATKLLDAAGLADVDHEPSADDAAEKDAAEAAMWAWYREWSRILRIEIADGRLLRELGLTRTIQRTVVEEVDDDLGEEDVPDAAAAPTAAPAAAPQVDTSAARADLKGGNPFTE